MIKEETIGRKFNSNALRARRGGHTGTVEEEGGIKPSTPQIMMIRKVEKQKKIIQGTY